MAPAGQQTYEIDRQDIQAVISRAAELRALHAALLSGGSISSPATLRLSVGGSSLSPSRASHQSAAEDYPVFMPSYEEEPLPAYHYLHHESQNLLETSSISALEKEEENGQGDSFDDKEESNLLSMNRKDQMLSTMGSQKLYPSSCTNHVALEVTSPRTGNIELTSRSGSKECKVVTACNKCKPATISRVSNFEHQNYRDTIIPAHAVDSTRQSSSRFQNKKGSALSWLFPRLRRKPKSGRSLEALDPEGKVQIVKDGGICSLETLKKALLDATENRDSALAEVGEMRSSLEELKQKLMHLEAYCEELKKALKQTKRGKYAQFVERHNLTRRTRSMGSSTSGLMPVSHEVMVEGFLQVASEAGLSVKQLCKALISQSEETDINLIEKLNILDEPDNLTLEYPRYSKRLQYHLEALINQTLYQDFENSVFQLNGAQRILDPQQDCLENFSTFVALRSLSWKEVLTKGSQYYNDDLSKFCDKKMSSVVSVLDWSVPWPEQLSQSFFVAAKCIWLLHLLAFSFGPPLTILRVEENRSFDPLYMEDILSDRHRAQDPAHVKIMVMPGFYVQDRLVIRCKVLCRHR